MTHKNSHRGQLSDISAPEQQRSEHVEMPDGDEYEVDSILRHKRAGRGFTFLTLMTGEVTHEAEWLPKKSVVDKDGTSTKSWKNYIRLKNILSQYKTPDGY